MRGWIELLGSDTQRITVLASSIIGVQEHYEAEGSKVFFGTHFVNVVQSRDQVCAEIAAELAFEAAVGAAK